jgi:hypothetical protein
MQTQNMSSNANNNTCIICYKPLSLTNNCTTVCGHKFCLSCLLSRSSNRQKCPYCNQSLTNSINANDVHMNIEDFHPPPNTIQMYSGEEDIYDIEEEEEVSKIGCVDDIAQILIDKEVTMVDILSYFDNRYNSRTPPYRHHRHDCHIYYMEYIEQTIEEAFREVDEAATI